MKIDETLEDSSNVLSDAKLRHADLMDKFTSFELRVKEVFAPYFRLPISQIRKPAVYGERISDKIDEEDARSREDIPF